MNILMMTSKNDKYGAQRVFLDQAAALHRTGHNVVVVGRADDAKMNGVRDVIVNGVPVIEDGKMTGKLPGKVLRGPGHAGR